MRRSVALPLAVLALSSSVGCNALQNASYGGKATATASAAEVRALAVDNRNGSIEVVRTEGVAGAEVKAEIWAHGATPEEANRRAAESKLVVEHDASGTLRVRIDFPAPVNPSDSASISVRAADAERLELVTSNGSIGCEGFTAPLRARTTNGAIRVERHLGEMDLDTSNGRIEVKRSSGGVQAGTSNGRIEIALAEGATSDVQARTSNGAISLEVPGSWQGTVEANTSNGSVELDAGGRGSTVRASRNAGTMTVGDPAAARATLRTSNGAVRVHAAK